MLMESLFLSEQSHVHEDYYLKQVFSVQRKFNTKTFIEFSSSRFYDILLCCGYQMINSVTFDQNNAISHPVYIYI